MEFKPLSRTSRGSVRRAAYKFLPRAIATALLIVAPLAGAADKPTPAKAVNLVLTTDSPQVKLLGDFQLIDGYLARSERVMRASSPGSAVLISPKLTQPGQYQVFLWWPQNATGAGVINATVLDAAGTTSTAIDQSTKGGQWNPIGVFEASARTPITISLRSDGSSRVIADAVRLFYVGSTIGSIEIEPERIPPAEKDVEYKLQFGAKGKPPFNWAIAGGTLPAGLNLDPATGAIAGRAAEAGTWEFSVEVQDAKGRRGNRAVRMDVHDSDVEK